MVRHAVRLLGLTAMTLSLLWCGGEVINGPGEPCPKPTCPAGYVLFLDGAVCDTCPGVIAAQHCCTDIDGG